MIGQFLDIIAGPLEVVTLLVIAWHSLCGLNHMSKDTRLSIASAVVLLFAGALARAYAVCTSQVKPDISISVLLIGFAIGMISDRRRKENCPCLPNFHPDKTGGHLI